LRSRAKGASEDIKNEYKIQKLTSVQNTEYKVQNEGIVNWKDYTKNKEESNY
jgi:hypothetical protein